MHVDGLLGIWVIAGIFLEIFEKYKIEFWVFSVNYHKLSIKLQSIVDKLTVKLSLIIKLLGLFMVKYHELS